MKISKRTRQNNKVISLQALNIKTTSPGGCERCTCPFIRRAAKLFLHSGIVIFALGDKSEAELFNFINHNTGNLNYE